MNKIEYQVKVNDMYVNQVSSYHNRIILTELEGSSQKLTKSEKDYVLDKFPNSKIRTITTTVTEWE